MIIGIKRGAQCNDLTPKISFVTGYILALWEMAGLGEFTITSGNDGKHVNNSRHYSNNAVDIRTRKYFDGAKHSPQITDFVAMLKKKLSPHGIDIILHPEDMPAAAHIHVEYDPKPARELTQETL